MKSSVGLILTLGALALAGCRGNKSEAFQDTSVAGIYEDPGTNALGSSAKFIVTPDDETRGRVTSVNEKFGFAVLTFPLGQTPRAEQRLDVYRKGAKVGELKVTRWQSHENVVADVLSGEVFKGDEVRLR